MHIAETILYPTPNQAAKDLMPAEYSKNPCRRLITKKGARWELTSHGTQLLELLTY